MTAPLVVPPSVSGEGFVGRIPVRNLWLLMLYASELFRQRGARGSALDENPDDIPDLVAEMLALAVEQRLLKPLTSGYQTQNAVLTRVRGRIDNLTTECHQLLARGLVACVYDVLTIDTARNRFVRGALVSIASLVSRPELAHRCRTLAKTLHLAGVGAVLPSRAVLSVERFGRHDAGDQIMVAAARLAMELALPSESAGASKLFAPEKEESWVRRLYERAVGGFYQVALRPAGWGVHCGARLQWQIGSKSEGIDSILPSMRTDIVLEHRMTGRRTVIDTKFTSLLTKGWHRDESLKSGYLYQIYAYLLSQVGKGDALADVASGLLLHPSIGEDIDESVVIQGHAIRFATVDLTEKPARIQARLLSLVVPRMEQT